MRARLDVLVFANTTAFNRQMRSTQAGLSNLRLGAIAALGGILAKGVKSASDLNEGINVLQQSLGGYSRSLLELSKNSSDGYGLTQTDMVDKMGKFAGILRGAGFSAKDSQGYIKNLMNDVRDLASFWDKPVGQTTDSILAVITGQVRPGRQYGIDTTVDSMNKFMKEHAMYTGRSARDLTQIEKMQVRIGMIRETMDKQHSTGDFNRTKNESFAIQSQILMAKLGDLATDLGKTLLPNVLNLTKALIQMLPLIKTLLGTAAGLKALQLSVELGRWVKNISEMNKGQMLDKVIEFMRMSPAGVEQNVAGGFTSAGPGTFATEAEALAAGRKFQLKSAAKFAGKGLLALGGGLAVTDAMTRTTDKHNGWDIARTIGESTAGSAMIGSAFGPWGTAIGAAIGLGGGVIKVMLDGHEVSDKVAKHANQRNAKGML